MLLQIYLGISIITLICIVLANFSMLNRAINKYSDQIETYKKSNKKKDISGTILAALKLVIVAFIPFINIIILLTIIFVWDKVVAKVDEDVEKALEEAKKNAI